MAVALCALDVALSALTVDAPLRLGTAPAGMRWSLVAQECAMLAVMAVIPAWPARRRFRLPLTAALAAILTTGWFAFTTIGRFPGVDAFAFFLTVPAEAFQHVVQLHASIIPETLLVIVALALALDGAAHLTERRLSPRGRSAVIAMAALLLTTSAGYAASRSAAFSSSGREVYDSATGVGYRTNRLWRTLHEGSAGAMSALLLSLLPSGTDRSTVAPADPAVKVMTVARTPGQRVVAGTPSTTGTCCSSKWSRCAPTCSRRGVARCA